MPKPSDVGVIVARFQVHKLHPAHKRLIESVYNTHKQTLIVLGVSPARVTARNPLDFEARKKMVLEAFPKATVLYIKDEASNEVWSHKLDELIEDYLSPAQTVTLFGGRDSFAVYYKGRYPVQELEPETYVSGTELRLDISRATRGTEDFRAGVIWASANTYPRVNITVDVGINDPVRGWLLVRKPNEALWRFPGGFVQPTDATLETAVRREVMEEVGVEIGTPEYRGSRLIDDWRYRRETEKILTAFFRARYIFGSVRPADDVSEARWFKTVAAADVVAEHRVLWDMEAI